MVLPLRQRTKTMKKIILLLMFTLSSVTVHGGSSITINGKTIHATGTHVVIVNGQVVSGIEESDMVQGSGEIVTEVRKTPVFKGLVLNLAAEVRVRPAEETEVSITADDNIIPLITTEVAAETLTLSVSRGYSSEKPIRIDIKTPAISHSQLNGSGSIDLDSVAAGDLGLAIFGSGRISATGQAEALSATINGSGKLDLRELAVDRGDMLINGSGDADLLVSGELRSKINGSGNIVLHKAPDNLRSQIRGSGEIIQRP